MTDFEEEFKLTGYGGEPTEAIYENGTVLQDDDAHYAHRSQDEHFAAVEHLVDQGVANYADAAKRLSYSADDYEIDSLFTSSQKTSPTPGAAVGLAERAESVAILMDGIAMENKLRGAQRSNAMDKYENPGKVLDRMQGKAERLKLQENRAVEALAQTAAMRTVGFTEAEIAASESLVRRTVASFRKTGREAVAARNKQKLGTARTARKVLGNQ